MPDFNLRQLEVFCKVVELASFTRAAGAVHLAQATVSERIATLERDVGARLLDRLGRRVEPTPVGRRLYARAREILLLQRDIQTDLEALLGVEAGALTVGASTIPAEYLLPRALARFRGELPAVRVRVLVADTDGVLAQVAAGELELGVVGAEPEGEHLRSSPLWDDELVLAVPSDHRLAGQDVVGLEALASEPFVLREPGSGTRRALERALAAAGHDGTEALDVVAELGSTAAVKQGILHGLGVSVLSARAVELELAAGAIATLGIEGLELGRRFHLVSDPRRTASPLGERFAAFLLGAACTG